MRIPAPAAFALAAPVFILLSAGAREVRAAAPAGLPPAVLRGRQVAAEAEVKDGRLEERYLALAEGKWIEIATAGPGETAGPVSILATDGKPLRGRVRKLSITDGTLIEDLAAGEHRALRKLTIVGDGPWIHVVTRFEPAGAVALHQAADRLRFSHRPDWSFSPSVGGFNPDAQYKAPLILVQTDRLALGVVPDLTVLGKEELTRSNHALDLDVPAGPVLCVGFMPAQRVYHAVYGPDPGRTWTAQSPVENAYYVLLTATAAPGEAYRQAVRFHWERFGRRELAVAAQQQAGTAPEYRRLALWDDWRKKVWQEETPQQWLTVPLPDGSTGGSVRTARWGPGPSVYLSSWFNSLRTSFGMALWARRTGNAELLTLARQTVDLALRAPGRDGAMKCIAVPTGQISSPLPLGKGQGVRAESLPAGSSHPNPLPKGEGTAGGRLVIWAAGDGSGASTKDGFLGYDMCWTGYWLLRWRAAELPGSQDILPRCGRLAEFMIARQGADGMLPTRFAEDGAVQAELSRTVKAETGPVALFLLELYRQDRNPKYLDAARKGLDFLEKQVIPRRQWYDYETFWSCAHRRVLFDTRTGQWPANNLALGQTVAAFLSAYRATGEKRYLAAGRSLLDYLLLYQQCWTNPVLQNLSCPAMLLGGFTTQNSDAEWSDARQSQCGNILLDYYRATGEVEYLERGVAALRAQFPVSPAENWAHVGYGGRAGVSSFHWGTGSGMAGVEIEEDYLRDAVVDVAAGRGVGVNGLNVTRCMVRDGRIDLTLTTPFTWPRPPTVVFRQTQPAGRYRVRVNGAEAGVWGGKDLEKGIPLAPLKSR